MKKILFLAATMTFAIAAAKAAEIRLYVSSFSWAQTVKDDLGEVIHEETESWPATLGMSRIKTGFKYEYMDDPGTYVGNTYQYFDATASYDLSALAGIDPASITSAKLVGLSLTEHDVDSLAAEPTFNYVLAGTPSEICDIDAIGDEIDITSYVLADVNAGRGTANLSFKCPDIAIGTHGENFARVSLLINQDAATPSYIAVAYEVPEPAAMAALLGGCALALAAYRRRR